MAEIVPEKYTIALVLVLVFIAVYAIIGVWQYFANQNAKKYRYPPWLTNCPDYWTYDPSDNSCTQQSFSDENNDISRNGKRECAADGFDKYSPDANGNSKITFKSTDSLTDKCNWAKTCNVQWDGISSRPCSVDQFSAYESAS